MALAAELPPVYFEQFIYPTKNLYRRIKIEQYKGEFVKATPIGEYISEKDFKTLLDKVKVFLIPEREATHLGNALIFNKNILQELEYRTRR